MSFFNENQELFKEKFTHSYKDSYSELSKLKKVVDFINKSENYKLIKKVSEKHGTSVIKNKNDLTLLNKCIFDNANKKLINNMKLIKEIKDSNITGFDDICYELYMTPDTINIKLYSQIVDIQKMVDEVKEKLGNYDLVNFLI